MSKELINWLKEEKTVYLHAAKQKMVLVPYLKEMELDRWRQFSGKQPVILISKSEQLYDVVLKMPEIIWDIIEFAEKPLEVLLSHPKFGIESLLNEQGEVKLSLLRSGELFNLLSSYRKPLAAFLLVGPQADTLPPSDYVLPLMAQEIWPEKAKTMRLALNGEFKFL